MAFYSPVSSSLLMMVLQMFLRPCEAVDQVRGTVVLLFPSAEEMPMGEPAMFHRPINCARASFLACISPHIILAEQ